jgi:hypothetical protein
LAKGRQPQSKFGSSHITQVLRKLRVIHKPGIIVGGQVGVVVKEKRLWGHSTGVGRWHGGV